MKIIIIGFKYAGKSTCGKLLAKELCLPSYDLDELVTQRYESLFSIPLKPAEIAKRHSLAFFRKLEHETLSQFMQSFNKGILSLGGGTLMNSKNQKLVKEIKMVYVDSPIRIIVSRMSETNNFLGKKYSIKNLKNSYRRRKKVYEALTQVKVKNDSTFKNLKKQLHQFTYLSK